MVLINLAFTSKLVSDDVERMKKLSALLAPIDISCSRTTTQMFSLSPYEAKILYDGKWPLYLEISTLTLSSFSEMVYYR